MLFYLTTKMIVNVVKVDILMVLETTEQTEKNKKAAKLILWENND